MNFKQIRQQASFVIQEAIVAQAKGNEDAIQLFEKAFEFEKQAALMLINDFDNEPTRSGSATNVKCKIQNNKCKSACSTYTIFFPF